LKNDLKRKIITTADGSKTIQIEDWNEQYHSIHGAIQEAYHVFIKHGLHKFKNADISILEIGFGTGLNALITLVESQKHKLKVTYEGVEAYPVSLKEVNDLNYVEALKFEKYKEQFLQMHKSNWGEVQRLAPNFTLFKSKMDFKDIDYQNLFNLIYFDAFGFRLQPELWSVEIFEKMYQALKNNGILITYSAKGSVRRAMQEVGFTVERLPGPPGKREMLRAIK
jgi:tRNA U34 5-methylaminomethyl-2-thiouridine-forming methyltransferase MnmC